MSPIPYLLVVAWLGAIAVPDPEHLTHAQCVRYARPYLNVGIPAGCARIVKESP